MQSGVGGTEEWELSFPPQSNAAGSNTRGQLRLRFESRAEAIAYADRNQIAYDLEIPSAVHPIKPKVYADNFRFSRTENWTH
jgi:hypothetical protein